MLDEGKISLSLPKNTLLIPRLPNREEIWVFRGENGGRV